MKLLLLILLLLLIAINIASAAECVMKTQALILDCKTYETAKKHCNESNRCCDIAQMKKPVEK